MSEKDTVQRISEDDIFDFMLHHVLQAQKEEWMQQWVDEFDRYNVLPAPLPPPSKLRACKRKIAAQNRAINRQNGPPAARISHIPLKKLLPVAALLIFLLCSTVAFANRYSLFGFMFDRQPQYTELQLVEDAQTRVRRALPDEWVYFYMPQKLPRGFTLDSVKVMNNVCTMYFVGENPQRRISFTQDKIVDINAPSLQIDSEDAKTKKIMINGFDAYIATKDNWKNITFASNDSIFCGDFFDIKDKDSLEFMESLTKFKK